MSKAEESAPEAVRVVADLALQSGEKDALKALRRIAAQARTLLMRRLGKRPKRRRPEFPPCEKIRRPRWLTGEWSEEISTGIAGTTPESKAVSGLWLHPPEGELRVAVTLNQKHRQNRVWNADGPPGRYEVSIWDNAARLFDVGRGGRLYEGESEAKARKALDAALKRVTAASPPASPLPAPTPPTGSGPP